MLESFKDKYRSEYRTIPRGQGEEDPGLRCQDCKDEPLPARDSQVNCKVCPGCAHIREDLDMTDV